MVGRKGLSRLATAAYRRRPRPAALALRVLSQDATVLSQRTFAGGGQRAGTSACRRRRLDVVCCGTSLGGSNVDRRRAGKRRDRQYPYDWFTHGLGSF